MSILSWLRFMSALHSNYIQTNANGVRERAACVHCFIYTKRTYFIVFHLRGFYDTILIRFHSAQHVPRIKILQYEKKMKWDRRKSVAAGTRYTTNEMLWVWDWQSQETQPTNKITMCVRVFVHFYRHDFDMRVLCFITHIFTPNLEHWARMNETE